MNTHLGRARTVSGRPLQHPRTTTGRLNLPAVLRSLLLATLVFVAAAVIGGLLAGVAPAGEHPATAPAPDPAARAEPVGADVGQQSRDVTDGTTARDLGLAMIYAGATALTVSVAGMVIVLRRRRLW